MVKAIEAEGEERRWKIGAEIEGDEVDTGRVTQSAGEDDVIGGRRYPRRTAERAMLLATTRAPARPCCSARRPLFMELRRLGDDVPFDRLNN